MRASRVTRAAHLLADLARARRQRGEDVLDELRLGLGVEDGVAAKVGVAGALEHARVGRLRWGAAAVARLLGGGQSGRAAADGEGGCPERGGRDSGSPCPHAQYGRVGTRAVHPFPRSSASVYREATLLLNASAVLCPHRSAAAPQIYDAGAAPADRPTPAGHPTHLLRATCFGSIHGSNLVQLFTASGVTPQSRRRVSICIGVMCHVEGESMSCAKPLG